MLNKHQLTIMAVPVITKENNKSRMQMHQSYIPDDHSSKLSIFNENGPSPTILFDDRERPWAVVLPLNKELPFRSATPKIVIYGGFKTFEDAVKNGLTIKDYFMKENNVELPLRVSQARFQNLIPIPENADTLHDAAKSLQLLTSIMSNFHKRARNDIAKLNEKTKNYLQNSEDLAMYQACIRKHMMESEDGEGGGEKMNDEKINEENDNDDDEKFNDDDDDDIDKKVEKAMSSITSIVKNAKIESLAKHVEETKKLPAAAKRRKQTRTVEVLPIPPWISKYEAELKGKRTKMKLLNQKQENLTLHEQMEFLKQKIMNEHLEKTKITDNSETDRKSVTRNDLRLPENKMPTQFSFATVSCVLDENGANAALAIYSFHKDEQDAKKFIMSTVAPRIRESIRITVVPLNEIIDLQDLCYNQLISKAECADKNMMEQLNLPLM
jgi:hypothetical protein